MISSCYGSMTVTPISSSHITFLCLDIHVDMLNFHTPVHIKSTNHQQYLCIFSYHFPSTKGSIPLKLSSLSTHLQPLQQSICFHLCFYLPSLPSPLSPTNVWFSSGKHCLILKVSKIGAHVTSKLYGVYIPIYLT